MEVCKTFLEPEKKLLSKLSATHNKEVNPGARDILWCKTLVEALEFQIAFGTALIKLQCWTSHKMFKTQGTPLFPALMC